MSTVADRAWQIYRKLLPDGREVVVYAQLYGTGRLVVGPADSAAGDDAW